MGSVREARHRGRTTFPRWSRWFLISLLLIGLISPQSRAEIYRVPNPRAGPSLNFANIAIGSGARAWGMGGAFVAVADDATAASWNPAGLVVLFSPELTVALSPSAEINVSEPGLRFTELGDSGEYPITKQFSGTSSSLSGSYLDYLSYTHPFEIAGRSFVVQGSYQRALSNDLGYSQKAASIRNFYFDEGVGAGSYQQTGFDQSDLQLEGAFDIWSASFAFDATRRIAVGLALNYWLCDPELHAITETENVSIRSGPDQETESWPYVYERRELLDADGWNANLGIMWRPTDAWSFGAVYKSSFDLEGTYDETTSFRRLDTGSGTLIQYDGKASIDWPSTLAVGASFRPASNLLLSLDWTQANWSSATLDFDGTFLVDQPDPVPDNSGTATYSVSYPVLRSVGSDAQADVEQLRFGVEHLIQANGFSVPVRAGIFTDRLIPKDANLDEIDMLGYSFGIGWSGRKLALDAAVVRSSGEGSWWEQPQDVISFQEYGELDYDTTRFFLSMVYRFGS